MRKLVTLLTMLLLFGSIAFAQQRTISGQVRDKDGKPIPFATVKVKGGTAGTAADANGNFTISANTGDVLQITAVNYDAREVTVGESSALIASLDASDETISEVIVTAQGIRRKPKELGFSVAKVSNEDITVGRSPQLAQSLSGKVSGLAVYNVNNSVDPSVKITLRGYRSLSGTNDALIVIDGTPLPPGSNTMLNLLNPNDIESITVLKGGQAATLYGSDGVNGALVITTKKGTRGKARVTFSNATNVERLSFTADFQDKYGSGSHYAASFGAPGYKPNHLDRMHDNWRPFENQQFGDPYNGEQRIIGRVTEDGSSLIVPYAPISNVRKDIWNTGITTNNQVAVSGGNETQTFYISLENNRAEGIVPEDESNRTSVRFASSLTSGKLTAGFNAAYVQAAYDRTTFDFYNETINQAAHIPLPDLRDWRNNKFAHPNGYYNDYYNNPYFRLDNDRTNYADANISGNVELNYKVLNWLNLYNKLGVIQNTRTQKNTVGKFIYSPWAKTQAYVPAPWDWANDYNGINRALTDIQGSVYDGTHTENVINNEFQVQANQDFGNWSTRGMLGFSLYDRKTRTVEVSSSSIVVPDVYNVVNRQGELGGGEASTEYRKYGYYADLLAGWKDMVFLHGSFRYDATSKFYKSYRSADQYSYPYYGFDVAASLTDIFPALKNNILNYAKLRAGYSRIGNDNITLYGLDLNYTNASGFPYGNTVGITVGDVLPDKDLSPEFVNTFEVGGEFQLLNNRVNLDFTYYNQLSEDLVTTVRIPNTTGFSNLRLNVGNAKNWGYEADVKVQILRESKLTWDISVRYSMNDNKVTKLYQGSTEFQYGGYSYANTNVIIDQPYPILKAIGYVRDPATGRVIVNRTTGYPLATGPLKIMGRTLPKHIMGAGTRLTYSGFEFVMNWEYRGGNVLYSDLGRQMTFTGSGAWTENRDPHIFPNSAYDDGTGKYVENTSVQVREPEYSLWVDYYRLITENFVAPAWFIKLRDINLNYSFPQSFVSKTKIFSAINLALYGRNLITIVDEKNQFVDPEYSFTTGNGLGISNTGQTPPVRQYGFNINLTF